MRWGFAARAAAAAFVAAVLAGCTSFRPTQRDAFVDDEGNVLRVEYGVASKPYSYKMVSPMNGVEVEGHDTKMVILKTPEPENDTLTCYICQNPSPKGTMYGTRDDKWRYLTVGLMCRLYLWDPAENDYILVFEGNSTPSVIEEDDAR